MGAADQILSYVTDYWNNNPKRVCLDDKNLRTAKTILEILNSADEGDYQINSEEFFTDFEDDSRDLDWDAEDEVSQSMTVYHDAILTPGEANRIRFGTDLVDVTKVQQAVAFYGSRNGFNNNGTRIRPSLETMHKLFFFIKDKNHLRKLREYEEKGALKADRASNLKFLSEELKKEVANLLQAGRIVHEDTLRFVIAGIKKKFNLQIDNFEASNNWINRWKRTVGLSSRRITKFVALIRHTNKAQLEKDAKEFVAHANSEMAKYPRANVFNADQSGFQLVMNTARTLAITGSKHVHCTVQNASYTTHSYTVLPLISADGILHDKLFVTLKESKGKFPKKGHFDASNLVVTCHTSHIMTKQLMKTFFEKVVFAPTMPRNTLLIVDSWTSWKDQSAIDSVTPSANDCNVLVIPAGCTGLVQPCDVGLFGGFKKVVKTITAYGQITHPGYKMFSRDPTLKLISLVWRQLCHPKLRDWARYAWHASGYNCPRPPHFSTPSQLMFPRDVAQDCDKTVHSHLSSFAFIVKSIIASNVLSFVITSVNCFNKFFSTHILNDSNDHVKVKKKEIPQRGSNSRPSAY